MLPRPRDVSESSSLSSSSKPQRDCIRVYILQAKLDASVTAELYALIDSQRHIPHNQAALRLELCGNASDANIIISNVRMRKRLERHLDWNIARQKAIVTPQWLRDSIKQQRPLPCGEYCALSELHDETVKNCPDCNSCPCNCLPRPATVMAVSASQRSADDTTHHVTSPRVLANYAARYACLRASPLVCPNQALAAELGVLRLHRDLEGKAVNALSYERAISVIKAYPRAITLENFNEEVKHLLHIGEKIQSKIKEFIRSGAIEECETIRASERFQSLKTFTTIHGVGATTARNLYSIGLRTLEDMELYYDVSVAEDGTPKHGADEVIFTPNGKRVPRSDRLPDLSIQAALALQEDLDALIPREEVEEMHAVVMAEVEKLQPGCVSTIVGGYRRGKRLSNDVDIVISHRDLRSGAEQVKGLCKKLVQRLYERGLVTHVTHLSGFHEYNALRTSHWDSLEKALTVFKLPSVGDEARLHRRLDLIFAAPEAYWTGVVGWTGSKMFERDLRLWAKKEKGIKFDSSGITRRHDSKMYFPQSEQEVFELLGLEWIDPMLRNADV